MSSKPTPLRYLWLAFTSLMLLSAVAILNPVASGVPEPQFHPPVPGAYSVAPAPADNECSPSEMRHSYCEPRYVKII